jgi:hypothetical protein
MLEDELAVWFGNSSDRGTGGRRLLKPTSRKETESESFSGVPITRCQILSKIVDNLKKLQRDCLITVHD